MRLTVISVALLLLCLSVDAFKMPKKKCSGQNIGIKACSCKCNAVGKLSTEIFCFITGLVCQSFGIGLRDGCCAEFAPENNYGFEQLIEQASGHSR